MLNEILNTVEKPGRYLGGELNSLDLHRFELLSRDPSVVRFCLVFPDTYEVGMSHLGIQLLYQILNEREDCIAERCFMPYPDLEAQIRAAQLRNDGNLPKLWSLETKTPLDKFDIIGFSLQYELCGTNILSILELGGIPLHSSSRGLTDPMVIGGGPACYNPEPFAPFFDAFLLGDGEEAIHEIVEVVRRAKVRRTSDSNSREGLHLQAGDFSREQILHGFNDIDGIYVPQFFVPKYDVDNRLVEVIPLTKRKSVTKRFVADLSLQPQLSKPIVPLIDIVHDRLGLEVMRGCVRGCRFCQAGFVYRPQRERTPEKLIDNLKVALENTGYEQVSLLSLSTADYSAILPLLDRISHCYSSDELEVSFPSTRVDALTTELLEKVPYRQRHRFTLAPEGGSQRLRDVINKGLSDEQILETIGNLFALGWHGVKLYFMIGLPTETDLDLEAIVELARKIKHLSSARGKDIIINASTFVPKPNTPFQWAGQISPEETERRQRFLASRLRSLKIGYRFHDSFSTLLEGVFSRGGRNLAKLIERAYDLGCRLDSWPEYLNRAAWEESFKLEGLDPVLLVESRESLLDKHHEGLSEIFPWHHLSACVGEDFLKREYERALGARTTRSCLDGYCSGCEVCDDGPSAVISNKFCKEVSKESGLATSSMVLEKKTLPTKALQRVRFCYGKRGVMSRIGHFETSRAILRALRRAELPLLMSQGFAPKVRVSFGPPLQQGVESNSEYFDCLLREVYFDDRNSLIDDQIKASLIAKVNKYLPEELEVLDAVLIPLDVGSIQQTITGNRFRVSFAGPSLRHRASSPLSQVLSAAEDGQSFPTGPFAIGGALKELLTQCEIQVKQKNGSGAVNSILLDDFVDNLCLTQVDGGVVQFDFDLLSLSGRKCPRATDVIWALAGLDLSYCSISKIGTYFANS